MRKGVSATLSTSADEYRGADCGRMAFACLILTVIMAVIGEVYEYFSFGVFSFPMLYAFKFYLIGGVLFWQLIGRKHKYVSPGFACLWNAGLTTLTVGGLVYGALEIYGTYHPLTAVFWIAGGVLMLLGIVIRRPVDGDAE